MYDKILGFRAFKIKNKSSAEYYLAKITLWKRDDGKVSFTGNLYYSYNSKGRPSWHSGGQIDMSLNEIKENDKENDWISQVS